MKFCNSKETKLAPEEQLGVIPPAENVLPMVEYYPQEHKETMWIADSGASTHMGMDTKE